MIVRYHKQMKKMNEQRLNINNTEERSSWCQRLGCSDDELMFGVSKVGTSFQALHSYLQMNKNLIDTWLAVKSKN
jgi:hypothetical protein